MFGAHLIYTLEAEHDVDISTTSAALNILGRGVTAVAPALSLVIIRSSAFAAALALGIVSFQIVVMWAARALFFDASRQALRPAVERSVLGNGTDRLLLSPVARWGLIFSLLANFSLAGVTLLLMRLLKTHDAPLINEISALYLAFFATQVIVLIHGNRAVPATTLRGSSLWLSAVGTLTITVAITGGPLRLTLCLMLGLAYGFLLSSISKTLLPSIGRTLYVSYSAWAQPIGRGASIAATLVIGAAMSNRLETPVLLIACGVSAVVMATMLYLIAPANGSQQQA